jgi:hypothetical protein
LNDYDKLSNQNSPGKNKQANKQQQITASLLEAMEILKRNQRLFQEDLPSNNVMRKILAT